MAAQLSLTCDECWGNAGAPSDFDQDGTDDCADACAYDPSKQTAGACGCGVSETDGDGDGRPDCTDACPSDPATASAPCAED